MPAISIIIPIYKAEKYLRRCLDSILKQSFKDFEVIMVDDGSPDNSGEICDRYALNDCRFQVVHKENGGVSSARSVGVELAKGKYSIQFDPDDWIESDMLKLMYDKIVADDADFVICDMFMDYPSSSIIISHIYRPDNIDSLYDNFLTGKMPASLANKLIKHKLYKEKNYTFNREVTRWEDTMAVCSLMDGSERISFVDVPLYHYDFHSNSNSLARNVTLSGLKSQMIVCDYFMDKFKGTIHEAAVHSMRKSTKALSYNILKAKEYIRLYEEYNKEVVKSGLRGMAGISGLFMAMSILTRSDFPQYLYTKLKSL